MTASAWAAALAALEQELDVVEAALASGALFDVGMPDPPYEDLGPLPQELRFRATALQARMARIEDALVAALSQTRRAVAFNRDDLDDEPRFLDARW